MSVAIAASPTLTLAVEFGRTVTRVMPASQGCGLELKIPVLGDEAREVIFPQALTRQEGAGLPLFTQGGLLLGCVTEPVTDERALSGQTQAIYRRVLAAARGHHLYRIWNYVPRINALAGGLENYRAFCQGRSLAFEAGAGAGFPQVLPSASGVGSDDGCLSLVFVAGSVPPRHFENPEQIPAYRYPQEHGPRSPSFSRATVAVLPDRTLTFISGTAAIKGHQTVAPGTLEAQLDCTVDNLRLISSAAGLGDDLGAGRVSHRHFKVYLRHAADFAVTRTRLEHSLLRSTDRVIYLQADICRAALNVEIEATLVS
jgi:hypothetical protein